MRRVAATRVYINEKEFHNNHIVELLDYYVVNHYPLYEELPMTEWLGGAILFAPVHMSEKQLRTLQSVSGFYEAVKGNATDVSPRSRSFAYHVSSVDFATESFTSASVLTLLTDEAT